MNGGDDVHRGGAQSVDDLKDESRRDVSRVQVDHPDKGGSGTECGTGEGQVMRDDDTALSSRTFEYLDIWPANQLFLADGSKVETSCPQASDDVRSDVLVCQEREVERRHAVMLSSQVCSPFSASAAYRNAAARPSGVS